MALAVIESWECLESHLGRWYSCGVWSRSNWESAAIALVSFWYRASSDLGWRLAISTSDNGARAATMMTAVREAAEVEIRCLEDARAALREIFEAASASGCEECRPEGRFRCMAMAATTVFEQRGSSASWGRGGGDWYSGLAMALEPVQEEETRIVGVAV